MKKQYKERWVCFACRKMFRYLRLMEAPEPGAKPMGPAKPCPQCDTVMTNIGGYFAPPPRVKKRLWEAAYQAAQAGYHCHSEGASRRFWEIAQTHL